MNMHAKRFCSVGIACLLAVGTSMPATALAQGETDGQSAAATAAASSTDKVNSKLPVTSISAVKAPKAKQLKIGWKKKKTDSYQVQVALKKDFSYGKKTQRVNGKKTSCTLKNLKSGRVYYIHIRTCKKTSKGTVYGAWSKTKAKRCGIYYDKGCYGYGLSSKKVSQVNAKVKRFVKTQVKGGMTDNEVLSALGSYLYMSKYVKADTRYSTPYHHYENTAWALFFYKHAACSGFARGSRAMLEAAGLKVKHVNASKWTHQWLDVWLDGKKMAFDPFAFALFK